VDEATIDLGKDAELLPDVAGERQERLADVKAREALLLQDQDAAPALPQEARG